MADVKIDIPQEDIDKGKGLAWLSYWGILFLVPLLAQKDNKYSQFHAKQGLALFIYYLVWIIGLYILILLFAAIRLGIISLLLMIILWLGLVVLGIISLIGFIQALTGKVWKAPLGIGDFAQKFNF